MENDVAIVGLISCPGTSRDPGWERSRLEGVEKAGSTLGKSRSGAVKLEVVGPAVVGWSGTDWWLPRCQVNSSSRGRWWRHSAARRASPVLAEGGSAFELTQSALQLAEPPFQLIDSSSQVGSAWQRRWDEVRERYRRRARAREVAAGLPEAPARAPARAVGLHPRFVER